MNQTLLNLKNIFIFHFIFVKFLHCILQFVLEQLRIFAIKIFVIVNLIIPT